MASQTPAFGFSLLENPFIWSFTMMGCA